MWNIIAGKQHDGQVRNIYVRNKKKSQNMQTISLHDVK